MKWYLSSLFIAGIASAISFGAIIFQFDPETAHLGIKALFWLSFFIFLGSWGALIFIYFLKQKIYTAIRRGIILSFTILAMILAFRYTLLKGWSLIAVPAIMVIIEILIARYISKSDYIEDYA